MKPPPFAYHAARSVEDALAALADGGPGAKVLAGGQSLVPLLNMRLAAPSLLVDISGVEELATIDVGEDAVRVGAAVRHRDLERHDAAGAACPLLGQALAHVAHPVIRNRGTVVGSLAHADPAGELPAVLALLDGSVEVARREDGTTRRREVPAADLFLGPLEAALSPGDLVTHATFRVMPATAGSAFEERARRHGDYALAGVAAVVDAPGGRIARARVSVISVSPVPVVIDCSDLLEGASTDEVDGTQAAERVAARVTPETDLHASAEYRRHLAGVLTDRALQVAAGRAAERGGVTR